MPEIDMVICVKNVLQTEFFTQLSQRFKVKLLIQNHSLGAGFKQLLL